MTLILAGAAVPILGILCSSAFLVGAILFFHFLGWLPPIGSFGNVDLLAPDVVYLALLTKLLIRSRDASLQPDLPEPIPIRTSLIVFFLIYIGVSVARVAVVDPSFAQISLVSWIRLIQTASLIWIVSRVVRSSAQLTFVMRASALGALGAILVASLEAFSSGRLSFLVMPGRYGGFLSPNALGLTSGLLILMALYAGISKTFWIRASLVLSGCLGILLSRSVAGIVSTMVCLALAGLVARPDFERQRGTHVLRIAFWALPTAAAILIAVGTVRPESLPTSPDFRHSSAVHRLVLGTAGWRIFLDHPTIGVGWRRSSSPAFLSERDVMISLRTSFEGVNPAFFPDVNPTSVHNAYIQILAELGVVGFLIFVLSVRQTVIGVRRVIRGESSDESTLHKSRFLILALISILIWLNDNPIYGGQTETIALSVFLGALVAHARLASRQHSQDSVSPKIIRTPQPLDTRVDKFPVPSQ